MQTHKLMRRDQLSMLSGAAIGMIASTFFGCASDTASGQADVPVEGSGQVVERSTPVSVVQSLYIRVPFDVTVESGEPKQIVLRGEDNLLDHIRIEEDDVSNWRIAAPLDLMYTQNEPIAIEVPYIDMVEVTYVNNVRFIDFPSLSMQDATQSE